jgi:fructuronate reductase
MVRGDQSDRFERVSSIVRAEPADNLADFLETICQPQIALVTLTITEAGYRVTQGEALQESVLGRLTLGLQRRQIAGLEPLALVSCDNMPDNASALKAALVNLGADLGGPYLGYLSTCSFVGTSVDRITPATAEADILEVKRQTGFSDGCPVVTEEFSDWVLEGEFPQGRPDWESAGAKFVSDIAPFESRKLWLLNGAHSLMASYGKLLGYEFVHEAVRDEQVLASVNELWDDACGQLPQDLDLDGYRSALLERFRNPRIAYSLSQIAKEGLTKTQVRIAAVASLAADATGAQFAIASYIAAVRLGLSGEDSRQVELNAAIESNLSLLTLISDELAAQESVVDTIDQLVNDLLQTQSSVILSTQR